MHKLLILTENVCQGGKKMPTWLQSQMQKAFYEKDRYQIKLLNQCWFFYQKNFYWKIITPYKGLIIVLSKGFNRTTI